MTRDSRYGLQLVFMPDEAQYQIYDKEQCFFGGRDADGNEQGIVWRRAHRKDEDCGEYFWPADVRAEYERLSGKPEFDPDWDGRSPINAVEFITENQGFNQSCAFGNLCEDHAVYCHNDGWLYSPRKCIRTWHTQGEIRDEDCPGFKPNPRLPGGAS